MTKREALDGVSVEGREVRQNLFGRNEDVIVATVLERIIH